MTTNPDAPIEPSQLRSILTAPEASEQLRRYYLSGTYTGGRFELLGGGGDRPTVKDRITAEDVVAVSLLSVNIPGGAALDILEHRANEITHLLEQIRADIDIWQAKASHLGAGSPAHQLWKLLESIHGCGWVTAGKLMARKRPRLIPVYDSQVRALLERSPNEGYWEPLRQCLTDNSDIVGLIRQARQAAELPQQISLLRCLDVVLWMTAKKSHRPAENETATPTSP